MKHLSFLPFFQRAVKGLLCLSLALMIALPALPAQQALAAGVGTTNSKVVLRKSADKESRALQTIPTGEDVDILESHGDWYKVRYGIYTGYVMKAYVNAGLESNAVAERIKALGDAPGIMRIGDENSDVKKLQQALEILGYYDGKIDGIYGSGTTEAVTAYQKDNHLDADGYAGTGTVTSIFGSCSKTSLTTQPEPGSAAAPTRTSATKSPSSTKAPSATKAPSSSKSSASASKYPSVSSISEIGSAPKTSAEGDSGRDVAKLQQALECLGYYTGAIDGVYGEGTVAAVKRFQTKRSMKADGIAGNETIRVIFGVNAANYKATNSSSSSKSKYKTETPDWFADDVDSLIPKNAIFTIKDVKTGNTFEAVRWSGYNHLDAEPRTKEDTQAMKAIYGGEWSWSRRPILIRYNGHVYAASMNGMPHGTTTISNGFAGHFCIHFKNSKTHGTKKVDADHQNAVNIASGASW